MAILLVLAEPVCSLYIYLPKVWVSIYRESKPVQLKLTVWVSIYRESKPVQLKLTEWP